MKAKREARLFFCLTKLRVKLKKQMESDLTVPLISLTNVRFTVYINISYIKQLKKIDTLIVWEGITEIYLCQNVLWKKIVRFFAFKYRNDNLNHSFNLILFSRGVDLSAAGSFEFYPSELLCGWIKKIYCTNWFFFELNDF